MFSDFKKNSMTFQSFPGPKKMQITFQTSQVFPENGHPGAETVLLL